MDLVRPGLVGLGLCPAGVLLTVLVPPSLVAAGGSDDAVAPGIEGEWVARVLNLVVPPAAALLGVRLLDRGA